MNNITPETSYWYSGEVMIALEVLLLIFILVVGYYYLKRRRTKPVERPELDIEARPKKSLKELIENAMGKSTSGKLDVSLDEGSYEVDEEMTITIPTHIQGKGAGRTRIIATKDKPALSIKNTKECSVSGVRIQGTINCSNSELNVENCQVESSKEGICIEAFDGSIVTFSGLIGGEGDVAIHARGESKVILKPPYKISDDEYVVVDPKSKISVHKSSTPENKPTLEKRNESDS